jgi:hypothetical protein
VVVLLGSATFLAAAAALAFSLFFLFLDALLPADASVSASDCFSSSASPVAAVSLAFKIAGASVFVSAY